MGGMDGGGGFGDSVVSVWEGWGGCDIWLCGLGVEGEGVGRLNYWLGSGEVDGGSLGY